MKPRNDVLTVKNKMTGKTEAIKQYGIEMLDWGWHFFVEDETAAYKAAYFYRNSIHGVVVEFAKGVNCWMVTVFNATAANLGLVGSK